MADIKQVRSTKNGVAIYNKDPNVAPNVYRSIRSKTIVPEGSPLDNEMQANLPQDNNRLTSLLKSNTPNQTEETR